MVLLVVRCGGEGMQQMKPLCKRARINRMSIKESLDNLPSGVCFARENGTLILCNRQMQRLYRRLAGTDLQRLSELRRAVAQPGGGISVLDAGAHILRFPEGRVWQFTESIATDAYGRRYTQALAQDITELADRRARLERENAALLDANARARKLYHELDDMVREEETLAMKMRLHDEIGVGLLSARKALEEGAPLAALQRCGAAWAAIAGIFRTAETGGGEAGASASCRRELEELIRAAAGIGIRIAIEGALPKSEAAAYLIITAMRVCATNAVRHAHADQLFVKICESGGAILVAIENSGDAPGQEITEGGGLSDLRRRTERAGGVMLVNSVPVFRLTLTLPKEG